METKNEDEIHQNKVLSHSLESSSVNYSQNKINSYPPVISVLGHVDHGKTTLLDAIRKTSVASREEGGITQGIGISEIEVSHEGNKRKITLIDTPGHEAFSNMRSQGVNAADIVLLIVAANDGPMPQTKESIEKIKEAKIPYIVVFTKSDLPDIIIDKTKQQLLKEGVMLEGLGGDVPYIEVSAKTGQKIQDLLDLILLVYDMSQIKKSENEEFLGIIIDSKLDKKRGNVASVIVKSGSLNTGDKIFIEGENIGKAKAMISPMGKNIKIVVPGDGVEILGLTRVILAGTLIYTKEKKVERQIIKPEQKVHDLADFFKEEEKNTISIILKTETSGELEAIREALPKDAKIVLEGQGDISISDILLAKDFDAIILGFNIGITREAKTIADNEKVFYRIYKIIYQLLEEIEDALDLIRRRGEEVTLGKASIIAGFEHKDEKILGVKVNEGRLAVNDNIRLLRGEKILGNSKIKSLRRGKQEVKEVGRGLECGVTLSPFVDFSVGDMLLSYSKRG